MQILSFFSCVYSRPHLAQRGGIPGTEQLVKSFLKIQPANLMQVFGKKFVSILQSIVLLHGCCVLFLKSLVSSFFYEAGTSNLRRFLVYQNLLRLRTILTLRRYQQSHVTHLKKQETLCEKRNNWNWKVINRNNATVSYESQLWLVAERKIVHILLSGFIWLYCVLFTVYKKVEVAT